jgi:uncharacterized protein YcsI (UPF0317 family)
MNSFSDGASVRAACRAGSFMGPTAGLAPGFVQANLVMLPRDWAEDFLQFCQKNPRPCPLLEITEPGNPVPRKVAAGADLRTDLPRYRIWQDGELIAEPTEICDWWRDDFVAFLLGCSFTFEDALMQAGIPLRHLEQNVNVPMYRTRLPCEPAGRFRGPLVVSMRPLTLAQAARAREICAAFPLAHGEPIQVGDPASLGIADLSQPDYGDPVEIRPGEVPVFWACGVTPQAVLLEARPPLAITHAPGHMFVTDWREFPQDNPVSP